MYKKILYFVKNLVKIVLCTIIDTLAHKNSIIAEKSLVIVKLDMIGDYVLFRNFIEILKNSDKYKNYKITLIGNKAYQDIALNLDEKYIEEFIFIDPNKMNKNFLYRYTIIKQVTSQGYEVLISPTYSREYYSGELLSKQINAKNKIAIDGNCTNMTYSQQQKSYKFYTKIIETPKRIMFEFDRTKIFFEKLLNIKVDIKKPSIVLDKNNLLDKLPKRYFVLAIGARTAFRCWSSDYFIQVASFILENYYDIDIVICGSSNEVEAANFMENQLKNKRVHNYVGKTTLIDFISVVSQAGLLISNESSGVHIAVGTNVPVIVLYNGFAFKRFIPYPKTMTESYFPIYHPEIEKDLEQYEQVSNIRGYDKILEMVDIKPSVVIEKIKYLISNNELNIERSK